MLTENTKQPNGVDETLTSEQRSRAEEYYKLNNIGSTAQERYEHFSDRQKQCFSYSNKIKNLSVSENIATSLAQLEFATWRWSHIF